jgi:hypothetical protein
MIIKRMALFSIPAAKKPLEYAVIMDSEPTPGAGLMRVSEWVEVEFTAVSPANIEALRLESLMAKRKRLAADYQKQCDELDVAQKAAQS